MSAKLEIFRAELEALETAGAYDAVQYDWLCETVERLEAEEKAAKPPATQAPTTEPAGDPVAALQTEMAAALANPAKYSDAQRDELVSRFNAAVMAAGQAQQEHVDIGQLQRDMLQAGADPGALTDQQRAELLARYDQAARQGPERRTTEALRGDLASQDLGARMRAAAALQQRGEDVDVDGLLGQFEQWQTERIQAARDPASFPPELQEAAKTIYAAEAAMSRPADPVEAAIGDLNAYVSKLRPPSLEQQLEALGVEVEPEPEQVPEPASQEA